MAQKNTCPPASVLGAPLVIDHAKENGHGPSRADVIANPRHRPAPNGAEFENGRRYHDFDKDAYFLPNDDIEAARLDLQHSTWKLTFEGAHGRVPVQDNCKRVLDVGTGTGIWAIEFAKAHPNIEVIGTDLSAIQPNDPPPNCHFIVSNAEDDWTFDRRFDYIHARMLTVGVHDWPRFFKQCWDNLEPGGWLESGETQFPPGRHVEDGDEPSAFLRWGELVYEATGKAGIDARASENFVEKLEAQGFVNVEKVDVQWPVGPWAWGSKQKTMGRLVRENSTAAIPAIINRLLIRVLGWTAEHVAEFADECLREVDDKNNHFYFRMCLHIAQKPHDAK